MSPNHSFPVIIVSAKNELLAKTVISDIIDNEPTESEIENKSTCCRLWRITNKYYTADVHLHPAVDGEITDIDMDSVQAHVIYLSENECEESVAEGRFAVAPALHGEATRLVLAQCSEETESLAAWAHRRGYELVPLLEPPPAPRPHEPFPELCGLARARASLHAQRWDTPVSSMGYESNSESSDGGEYQTGEEEDAVERMEEFCSLLGVVGGDERGVLANMSREDRLRRAEDLVAAFCRAMGDPSDRW